MTVYFSPTTLGFYPANRRQTYEAAGSWPEDAVSITADEYDTYGKGQPPSDKRLGSTAKGRPTWVPIPPESVETLAKKKQSEIETALAAELAAGMPYTMPDGTDDIIQTRPQDEPNLLGLAIEARDLRDSGETDAVQELRTRSNAVYTMTPQQMIDATDAAKAFKKAQLKKSWLLKKGIADALAAEDRDALETISW